jgi:hypothetical protein
MMTKPSSTKPSSSPERHTFQVEAATKRAEEKGEEVPEHYLEFWKTAKEQDEADLVDPEWQKDNMEYDLRTSEHMLTQVRSSDNYAQNLYAAMCNRDFQRNNTWPILTDQKWSCSWRHAGGIVADMRGSGDYIDWYCSGIGSSEDGYGLSGTVPEVEADGRTYVPEGEVTDEIRADLLKLGWIVLDDSEN